jgi:hypothetical protein
MSPTSGPSRGTDDRGEDFLKSSEHSSGMENGETVFFKRGETTMKLAFHQITEFSEV